jgi:septin family protein
MVKKIQLKRFKDKSDKFVVKKNNGMFDLPARIMICGSSGSGKTQLLLSLLLSDDAYLNDFKGENIYIWSPMINDHKLEYLVEKKKIFPVLTFLLIMMKHYYPNYTIRCVKRQRQKNS